MDLHPPWHYEDDLRDCADSSKEQTFERNPRGRSPPRPPRNVHCIRATEAERRE
jgi:hypothetical protein